MNKELALLATTIGLHFMGVPNPQFQAEGTAHNLHLAMDAQPQIVTQSSAGIPAFLTTYFDPEIVKVLVAPMRAAQYAKNEKKKGDWLSDTAAFPIIEATGETSVYGDYSNEGRADANVNWEFRQAFHYQVITQWGEKELEKMGLTRIDWANQKSMASILTLNKFQNKSYWYGVAGIRCYGLLNDPDLPAPIAPLPDGNNNISWNTKDALAIYADFRAVFQKLQAQTGGLLEMTDKIVVGISPSASVNLAKVTQYNVTVKQTLKENFPNLEIITAPEFSTPNGELMQMYVESMDGMDTLEVAFTEKLRNHAIVVGLSNFKQKKSQGTWGGIVKRPIAVASLFGF